MVPFSQRVSLFWVNPDMNTNPMIGLLSFGWVRIVNVRFILSFRGSRFPHRDNLAAQFPLIFEYLKGGVFIFPKSRPAKPCRRRQRQETPAVRIEIEQLSSWR